jgi:PAS domain S-box-containing protein
MTDSVSTTRQAHERAIEPQADKELVERVLGSLNDHFVMYDREWRYTYVNDAAARVLGLPKEHLIGRRIWDLFPEAIGNQYYQEVHRALAEGNDISFEHYYQPWNRWFDNHIYALPDGVSVLSIDITARKEAEGALRESEERFRTLADSAPVLIWVNGLEGCEFVNRHYLEFLGRTFDDVLGMNWATSVHPDDVEAYLGAYGQAFAARTQFDAQVRIRRADGQYRWLKSVGMPRFTPDGAFLGFVGSSFDVTEIKEAEERLQVIYQLSEAVNRAEAVEQIYALALAGLEQVLHVDRASILLFDKEGVMRFQAWHGLSAHYRRQVDGHSPWTVDETQPQPLLIPAVAQADGLGDLQQIILDEGIQALGFIPLVEQGRLLGKFMLYYDQPHCFSEAEVQWAQNIARKVAYALQRKQSDTQLQSYAHTLESLNQIQRSMAAELDLQKQVQLVTDITTELSGAEFGAFFYNVVAEDGEAYMLYTLSGVPREAFAHFPMPRNTALFGPTFRGEGIIRLADVRQDPRYGRNAPYYGTPPGHLPIQSYLAVPVVSHMGKVIGGLFFGHSQPGVFTEQTEQLVSGIAAQAAVTIENAQLYAQLKEGEAALRELNATLEQRVEERTAELQRSNRELDQFAYVSSHDLKAPLRAIDHLATWIAEDSAGLLPTSSQEHLTKLHGRVRRMEILLDDLLAYSRAGRQRHPAEEVDTAALIQDIVDLLAPPPGFTVQLSGPMPVMRGERVPLETVFRNLIGNSIKHHQRPAEGQVEITAQDKGRFVEFTVSDNGPGIDPAFHQRMFEMFQTLQPRDQVEGSGVGLALVKKHVESRGGSVGVESSLGEGATFRFTWPKTTSAK